MDLLTLWDIVKKSFLKARTEKRKKRDSIKKRKNYKIQEYIVAAI
ncbi:hypothetical protein [Clostridium oryzae]|nr:hypothetical protein [Clostridium oryzae]